MTEKEWDAVREMSRDTDKFAAEKEFFFHFGIVLSNVSVDVCDKLRALRGKRLRKHLHETGYLHQPECQGGYSTDRCPCAVSAKMWHTLMAVFALDEIRWKAFNKS